MFGARLGKMGRAGNNLLTQQALAILRKYGANAHVYLPGASGVAVSGLLSNNYTLSDGSTGFSAVDGTAGLVLDAMGTVGPELVTNGTLDTATGWTVPAGWSVGSGVATATATSASLLCTQHTPTQDKTYLVTFDAVVTSGTLYCAVGLGTAVTATTTGPKRMILKCGATVARFVEFYGGSFTGTVDNISVKEITGIHATQVTTANKPAERRGLFNQALWSNDIQNAVWQLNGTASKTGQTVNLPATSDAITQYVTSTALSSVGAQATYAALLSGSGTTRIYVRSLGGTYEDSFSPTITLTDTPTLYAVSAAFVNASHTGVGFGVFRSSGTLSAGAVTIGGSGLFQGTLTAAQILAEGGIPLTTSAAASNPSAGKYWWDFPTVGKGLVVGSPIAQMSDDSFCIVCVNAAPSAADKYIANLGCGAATQLISSVCIKASTGYAQAAWIDDGAAHIVTILDAVNHSGTPTVITAVKRAGVGYLRVNGVQVGAGVSLAAMGATTVTAGMIGGYNVANSSNQFIGAMGEPIMGKGTISDADLLMLERQCASTFPAAPTF